MTQHASMGTLIATMLKIGLIGFGGGNALVPVLQRETVETTPLISEDEHNREVVVANITPGALPIEIASGVGRKIAGGAGMVVGATAMGLPGAVFTLALLMLFTIASDAVMEQVRFASVGIAMLIVYVLAGYVLSALRDKKSGSREWLISLALIILVFGVTCGKKLAKLLGIASLPLPVLSTLDVLGVVFFTIFFTEGRFLATVRSRTRTAISFGIALLYLLSSNGVGFFAAPFVKPVLMLVMVVLSVYGFFHSLLRERNVRRAFPARELAKHVACWIAFILALSVPAFVLCPDALAFVGGAASSVLMSWGGGDAYLVIGQGIFVDTGMVTNEQYYEQIVTVSNAMPGSIIAKVLTGVGYAMGAAHGMAPGVAMAIAGFGCGVGMSGLTFLVIYYIYEQFEPLSIFAAVRRYIRPVIGGLLMTVALSLFSLNMGVASSFAIQAPVMVVLSFAILGFLFWLGNVRKVPLAALIAVSAVTSLVVCNGLVVL